MSTLITQHIAEWSRSQVSQRIKAVAVKEDRNAFRLACLGAGIDIDQPVTGCITQGLVKVESEQGKYPCLMEDIALSAYYEGTLCPIAFLYDIFAQIKGTQRHVPGLLARALLAFPSIIRKLDLQERLETLLNTEHDWHRLLTNARKTVRASFNPGEKHDFAIEVTLNVYLWTFFDSDRALHFCLQRLRGERAQLHKGFHLLCPLDPSFALVQDGWYLYPNHYLAEAAGIFASQSPKSYVEMLKEVESQPKMLRNPILFLV